MIKSNLNKALTGIVMLSILQSAPLHAEGIKSEGVQKMVN